MGFPDCNLLAFNYRPQRSYEGYVFTGVCDSVHGGVCAIPTYIAGGIPACLAVGGCLLWGVPAPRGVHAPGGCLLQGVCSQGVLARGGVEIPRKQMATVADGTHPTGMHSCL